MLACTKCGVAFPEWDVFMAEEILGEKLKCPYCDGELKWHQVKEVEMKTEMP